MHRHFFAKLAELAAIRIHARYPARFPYHRLSMGTRWVPGGHLVVSPSCSYIALSPRSLFNRSWTTREHPNVTSGSYLHPRSLVFFSFPFLIFFFVLLLCLSSFFSISVRWSTIIDLCLSHLLFSLFSDESRINKGTCNRPLGFIREDATSDLRAECNRDLYCDRY